MDFHNSVQRYELDTYYLDIMNMQRDAYLEERNRLNNMIDGDVFFQCWTWPSRLRHIFFRKPIGDTNCFTILLFLVCKYNYISLTVMYHISDTVCAIQFTCKHY